MALIYLSSKLQNYLWPILPAFPWKYITVGAVWYAVPGLFINNILILTPSKLLMNMFSCGSPKVLGESTYRRELGGWYG